MLRKRWPAGTLDDNRLAEAVEDLGALPFRRWPELPLLRRAFELRANLTAYDALYVTLAEGLDCPLVTADARLGRAPGLHCPVTILRTAGG